MIILITGASHTGKTNLAQKMLEKYKYPYLSIDHLKMGLIRSGYTNFTPENDDELTTYLWPIVKEIIRTAIENNQNLIVEGIYVPLTFRKDFDEKYISQIRFICLAMSDKYIDKHYDEIISHSCDIEKRLYTECNTNNLKNDNRKIIDGFTNAGEQVVVIDDDYDKVINELL